MLRFQLIFAVSSFALVAAILNTSRGDEVLQNLPPDALGFVVVRDIGATDNKLQKLSATLQFNTFGPLGFLRIATGISDGVDTKGDFLLALLPGQAGDGNFKFCVWLPVRDYDRVLASLGSHSAAQRINVVTIAGEDLLIAKHGNWAIVMDPDQRARMERMLAAVANQQSVVSFWQKGIVANDVTVVVLSSGVQTLLRNVAASQPQRPPTEQGDTAEDPFGGAQQSDNQQPRQANGGIASEYIAIVRSSMSELHAAAPELVGLANSVKSVGCSLRIDGDGNALAGVRVNWIDGIEHPARDEQASLPVEFPPALYDRGSFIAVGGVQLPSQLAASLTGAYVRLLVNELQVQERMHLDDATLSRFYESVEQAAAEATSASFLTLPGSDHEGVYTNRFLAIRVPSADRFIDLAGEAMRLWNQVNRDGQGGPRLVFDVEEVPIGERKATRYSLDIAAADGAALLPEARQAMEKLFGPGGKLNLLIAKIDDHTALLAGATPEQAAAMLKQLDRKLPIEWDRPPLVDSHRLLPEKADWRASFSPHGYTSWKSRESNAIVGTEVIGGPLVKEFPATPPIGVAGGVIDGEHWIDVAVPAETVRGAGTYLQPRRVIPMQR